MNFYNTINLEGIDLIDANKKVIRQEALILALFEKYPTIQFTPFDVQRMFTKYPITSIRRAITNLTERGMLTKCNVFREGNYGMKNHCWVLSGGQQELFK